LTPLGQDRFARDLPPNDFPLCRSTPKFRAEFRCAAGLLSGVPLPETPSAKKAERNWGIAPTPTLAVALQDAGCGGDAIRSPCRSEGPHVRRCWACGLPPGRNESSVKPSVTLNWSATRQGPVFPRPSPALPRSLPPCFPHVSPLFLACF
jgi:hypothetical protein